MLTNKNAWTPVTSIVFDHANGNIAFAATFYGGLYKSTDAGKTWNPANGTGNNAFPTPTWAHGAGHGSVQPIHPVRRY